MSQPPRDCPFCSILSGDEPASMVLETDRVVAFMDARQFHPGHVLIIPRAHVADIRDLDPADAGPLLNAVARVARAVDAAYPAEGLSVWHSVGPAANQEVPHLHIHVHPRIAGDGLLRVYPSAPREPPRSELDARAHRIASVLSETDADGGERMRNPG